MEVNIEQEVREFIAAYINIKLGLTAYQSRYIPNLILITIGRLDIQIQIYPHRLYIKIIDPYNRTYDEVIKHFNSYNDIEDIIDEIFKFMKPSRMY